MLSGRLDPRSKVPERGKWIPRELGKGQPGQRLVPMVSKRSLARQRCTTCREWYRPHPAAAHNQRTCSKSCRRKRRRALARARRDRDIQEYRVDERERQRRHRAKGARDGVTEEMSRPGLSSEVAVITEVIVRIWDNQSRLSRTGLRRQCRTILAREMGLVEHNPT